MQTIRTEPCRSLPAILSATAGGQRLSAAWRSEQQRRRRRPAEVRRLRVPGHAASAASARRIRATGAAAAGARTESV